MYNFLLALSAALASAALLRSFDILGPIGSGIIGLVVGIATLMALALRTFRRLEKIMRQAARSLQVMPPRIDAAIATLKRGYALSRWQFGVRAQVDAQIGSILFLQREFNKAAQHLEKAVWLGPWLAGAMLAVTHYKRKDYVAMRRTLRTVSTRARKEPLLWCLWAYLLLQLGERDEAIATLVKAQRSCGSDARVKENLLALQNNRRMKMRGFGEQWYQFHLERPPLQMQQQAAQAQGRVRVTRRMR